MANSLRGDMGLGGHPRDPRRWDAARRLGAALRSRLGGALLIGAFAIFANPTQAASGTPEYTIKAAYLFKFTPFVEWPTSAFATLSSPFYVCVLGSDPFGVSLDQVLASRQVGDHPVKIRRLRGLEGSADCHILYAAAPRPQVIAAMSKLRGSPVLTVTERSQGVSGSIVQFVVRDGRVRFTIDANAALANRMVISAKLLSLAAATEGGSQR